MKLKERKSIAKGFQKLRVALETEDKEEEDAQDTRSRSQKRRDDKARRQAEAAARKAEARRQAEQEELEISRKKKAGAERVTAAELLLRREMEIREMERLAEEKDRKMRRVVTKGEYENVILAANTNRRDDDELEAGTVDESIHVMITLGILKN
ncbi:OLC1v1037909C1 [Oldenlandia corymbosa var. corymbosa]|uniref:OLC1v1037909C1 n=1 Tax=Oldenlandia corymbosa var. corymbosa TaxID=529605 RepID=A0AAV1CZ72_OLDCO|nr:OLC1v1037909C1 [Oldenlandia corymbosa var. corymbosa]